MSLAKRLAKRLKEAVGTEPEELGLALGVATVETEAEFRQLPVPKDAFDNGMICADAAAVPTAVNVNLTEENKDEDNGVHSSGVNSDDDDTT